MDIRVNRKLQPTVAEQRIKNMLNIDVIEKVQALKAEYLKSHPDPQIDIQLGYVMHPIPLRPCDLLKIHQYKKGLFDKIPNKQQQQKQQQTRYKITQPLYSIANKIMMDTRNNDYFIEQDTNVSLIACLPAFYTRQQSCSKMKSNKSSIVPQPSMRIRSISNVYDFLTRPSTSFRPKTSNIKQRH